MTDPIGVDEDLRATFVKARNGSRQWWVGVLKYRSTGDVDWVCDDHHTFGAGASHCARKELERRKCVKEDIE